MRECYWGIKRRRSQLLLALAGEIDEHYSRGDSSFFTTFVNLYSPRVAALRHSNTSFSRDTSQMFSFSVFRNNDKNKKWSNRKIRWNFNYRSNRKSHHFMHIIMNQWRHFAIHPVWSRKLTLDDICCSSRYPRPAATICMACIIMQPHLNFKFLAAAATAVCLATLFLHYYCTWFQWQQRIRLANFSNWGHTSSKEAAAFIIVASLKWRHSEVNPKSSVISQ